MCENSTIIVYEPHANVNLVCDGSLHEKAKELLIDFEANRVYTSVEITVSQKALAGTLVSMCKKNFPKYGWVSVEDPRNALTKSKYLKNYIKPSIPKLP